jgi:hypothetical protein
LSASRRAGWPLAAAGLLGLVLIATSRDNHARTRADWRIVFDGRGLARVHDDTIELAPKAATCPEETHSALAVSRESFVDFELQVNATTLSQLRQPQPNPWETAWILWSYRDNAHFYYLALKTNGWELGKEDPAYPGNQRFLATGNPPAFPIGQAVHVRVRRRGNLVEASADGRLLARVDDTERPYRAGAVGLYTEDAHAVFEVRGLRP